MAALSLTLLGLFLVAAAGLALTTRRLRRVRRQLHKARQQYHTLFGDGPCMFFVTDRHGMLLEVNRCAAQRLGYEPMELEGQPIFPLFGDEGRQTARANLDDCLRDGADMRQWKSSRCCRDGGRFWSRETLRRLDDDTQRFLWVCEDISETRRLSAALSYQASHDELTGLINRRAFERHLQWALDTARAEQCEHALCYLDMDQFKVVNDTCGHLAGDELLRQVTALIAERIRKRDTLARLGGDEFAVLLEHCSLDQALRVARDLQQVLGDFRFAWEESSFNITASLGLVPIDHTTQDVGSLLSAADSACYTAKDQGRNRVHVYHPEDQDLAKRHGEMQWVARINRALEDNRFVLYCQPIVPIGPDPEAGFHYELLLRLVEPGGDTVPPGAFLPAAERYNLSTRLDRWVVTQALNWLADHPDHLAQLSLCSINLSGHSLADPGFLRFAIDSLTSSPVDPRKICFEITETAAIGNLNRAGRFIGALKALGCRFALDDFGSGLSSFAYLKNLPVDYLKIDGLFVKDIAEDPIDLAMVRSIDEIGKVMGKRTIAEFVENEAILQQLKSIGVDYAQGYGLGRPQPLDRLATRDPDCRQRRRSA